MDVNMNNKVIIKFKSKEIENVYSRYSNIPMEEVEMLTNFVHRLERQTI